MKSCWCLNIILFLQNPASCNGDHNKDGQKNGKDFSIHGVKPPIFDFALITH